MSQVTAIISRIFMNSDYNVMFYDEYDNLVQTLETATNAQVVGTYLVCGDGEGNSCKFFANTVTLIEGPTFSQSYVPIPAGFFQQDQAYFNRLSEMYTFISDNVVNVVIRSIDALEFSDGTVQTTAGGGGPSGPVNWGTITGTLSNQTDLNTALNSKLNKNATITGGTKTKITYDANGLVTAGANAAISDITGLQTALDGKFDDPTGTTSQYLRGDGTPATFPDIPTVNPSALTKTDDTNVTLTLGGSPTNALLQAVSMTLGWTGTLADSRISSASTWNAKQDQLVSGTNIKTINGNSILGSGNLTISGGGGILHGTTSGTDTYTTTITGVTGYNDADAYLIRFAIGNTGVSTLNINSLGAIPLYRNNDGELIGGDIIDGAEMLCIYNSSTNIFQVIGTAPNTLLAYVTNEDSVDITKGQPVYAFGGQGDRLTVKRAYNTGDSTSAQTVGLVLSTSIGVNQKGLIILNGQLDGLGLFKPSDGWVDGDAVYLGQTPGSVTRVKPHAPYHLVYLGFVTTASPGNAGRMYVRVQNGYEMDELHDVAAQNPNNGDTLIYNSTTNLWESNPVIVPAGMSWMGAFPG